MSGCATLFVVVFTILVAVVVYLVTHHPGIP